MNQIESARGLIEGFIDSAGIGVHENRVEKDVWMFQRGSAHGHLALIEDAQDPEQSRLYVSYAIMRVPSENAEKFFRRLLELNDHFSGMCAFSVGQSDTVWLTAGRLLGNLDPDELEDLVVRTGFYADKYDDVLLDEFGRDNALK